MLKEIRYIFKVIFNKRHPKLIFRELVCHWKSLSDVWVVPNHIYYHIDKHEFDKAQVLLNKQVEIWGYDDLAILRAQSYIDYGFVDIEVE